MPDAPARFLVKSSYANMPVRVGPTVDRNGNHRKGHVRLQRVRIKESETKPKPKAKMARYGDAVTMAVQAHAGQVRKGTENALGYAIPYITHPVAVSALVVKHGGDEDQAIAGLLHDVLEDGGPHYREPIRKHFGERVLRIVEACTDSEPDASGQKPPWEQRKQAYIANFVKKPDDALLVAGCDKLHNLQSILADHAALGDKVFDRFAASKDQTLWYYGALVQALAPRVPDTLAHALIASLGRLLEKPRAG